MGESEGAAHCGALLSRCPGHLRGDRPGGCFFSGRLLGIPGQCVRERPFREIRIFPSGDRYCEYEKEMRTSAAAQHQETAKTKEIGLGKQLFGTDGIRGVAGEYPLDPATVFAFGVALGREVAAGEAGAEVL